jgi:ribose-phosphate pyrophosphokinase
LTVVIIGKNYSVYGDSYVSATGFKHVGIFSKIFPDGEHYIRISDPEAIRNDKVLIINTMYPRQNDSLLETLMLIDAARRAGAREITVLITYLAYARQDKVFLNGEPITAEIVVKSIRMCDADSLAVIDIHNPETLRVFNGKSTNILVSDILVEKAIEYLEKPIIIAPDKGALGRARYAAEKLGLEYDYLVKSRDRITGEVSLSPKEVNVEDRDVVIVDDIISTGGTIALAAKTLYSKGARRIVVAATHGLLIGNALDKIRSSKVMKIYLANTLGVKHADPYIEVVDVSKSVVSKLKSKGLI